MLWPVVLLALIASGLHFHRPRTYSVAQQPVQVSSTSAASTARSSTPEATRAKKFTQFSPSATEPETERLILVMSDKSASLQLRRDAAQSLARIGTDNALAALKAALAASNPPYLKAAIAEGLGESPNPEAREMLHDLLNGKDETTARAAARGLALRGDADAMDMLGNALFNEQTPESVREEAARSLGDVDLPGVLDLLTRAIAQIQDDDVREGVLDGLGRRPFSETEPFFRNYLSSPDVSPDFKVLAIEAITDADGDVGPFLSNYLNDPNPDVRAAVKSALDFIGPGITNAQN